MDEHIFTFQFDCIISEKSKEIPYSPWEVNIERTLESDEGVKKIWLETKDGKSGTAEAKNEEEEKQMKVFVRNSRARPT
jgi:hypothetical protein